MTKRRPPKNRQPWPAFYLVTAALAGTAVVASLLLDYINMRKGEPAFIFAGGPQAGAGFTFWMDEVRFEKLGTLSNPRPVMASQVLDRKSVV